MPLCRDSLIQLLREAKETYVDDNPAWVFPDPIIDKKQRWNNKESGFVKFDDGTIYYGQLGRDREPVNGFGIYWIPLGKDSDKYEIWLGRRENGQAKGPNIRIAPDGSGCFAFFKGREVDQASKQEFTADGKKK